MNMYLIIHMKRDSVKFDELSWRNSLLRVMPKGSGGQYEQLTEISANVPSQCGACCTVHHMMVGCNSCDTLRDVHRRVSGYATRSNHFLGFAHTKLRVGNWRLTLGQQLLTPTRSRLNKVVLSSQSNTARQC